jgi:hypothetical protein
LHERRRKRDPLVVVEVDTGDPHEVVGRVGVREPRRGDEPRGVDGVGDFRRRAAPQFVGAVDGGAVPLQRLAERLHEGGVPSGGDAGGLWRGRGVAEPARVTELGEVVGDGERLGLADLPDGADARVQRPLRASERRLQVALPVVERQRPVPLVCTATVREREDAPGRVWHLDDAPEHRRFLAGEQPRGLATGDGTGEPRGGRVDGIGVAAFLGVRRDPPQETVVARGPGTEPGDRRVHLRVGPTADAPEFDGQPGGVDIPCSVVRRGEDAGPDGVDDHREVDGADIARPYRRWFVPDVPECGSDGLDGRPLADDSERHVVGHSGSAQKTTLRLLGGTTARVVDKRRRSCVVRTR